MNPLAFNFGRRTRQTALAGALLASMTVTAFGAMPQSPAKPISHVPAAVAPSAAGGPSQASPDDDIHDIRPPYHIPAEWLWIAWTAAGIFALVLGYASWRWYRRRSGRGKLPYELALEQLEAARRLMEPEQARAFSITVSEIVRRYIEETFPVRAAHSTTDEFLRDLVGRSDSPLVAHRAVLSDFLTHCDLAKFAKWSLSVPEMETLLESARTFVLATGKPVVTKSADPESSTASRSTDDGDTRGGRPAGTPTTLTSQLS
jgi:hypothetical protein